MATMSMVQALNSAMDVMLTRDPNVLIFGEDVGFYGGVFRVTDGLQKKHGDQRVFDAPIIHLGGTGLLKKLDGPRSVTLLREAKARDRIVTFDLIAAKRLLADLAD